MFKAFYLVTILQFRNMSSISFPQAYQELQNSTEMNKLNHNVFRSADTIAILLNTNMLEKRSVLVRVAAFSDFGTTLFIRFRTCSCRRFPHSPGNSHAGSYSVCIPLLLGRQLNISSLNIKY